MVTWEEERNWNEMILPLIDMRLGKGIWMAAVSLYIEEVKPYVSKMVLAYRTQ